MPPKETVWPMEPHTAAKHTILQKYLQAWLPIMSFTFGGRLLVVDGFCGPGRYATGEDGSPIIMLKAFLEHAQREKITAELVYIFIDEDKRRIANLEDELARLEAAQPGGVFPDQVKIETIVGAYEDVFTEALDSLEAEGKRPAETFAFVDPFGYTDASMSLNGRLMRFERCEALIYVPLPWVARHVGQPQLKRAMNGLFGCEDWRDAIEMEMPERRRFLHDLFRDQLAREGGGRLVRSFEIPTSRGNGYTLFFTTGHEKGLAVMKDAMWTVDPIEGRQWRDTTDPSQMVIFDKEPDTGPLLDGLREHFGGREFSIEEAESFTICRSAYKGGHLKRKTLAPAERAENIKVTTPRAKRGTYPPGTRMRFADTRAGARSAKRVA